MGIEPADFVFIRLMEYIERLYGVNELFECIYVRSRKDDEKDHTIETPPESKQAKGFGWGNSLEWSRLGESMNQ